MHHSFIKQCVTFGSAIALSIACTQSYAQTSSDPKQKALIPFDRIMSRWKSDKKVVEQAAPAAAPVQPPATEPAAQGNVQLPAESAQQWQPAPPKPQAMPAAASAPVETAPAVIAPLAQHAVHHAVSATPLPPTSLVLGQSPVQPVGNFTQEEQPTGQPIDTIVPTSMVTQAQLVAAQAARNPGDPAPIIIVMPGMTPPGAQFAPRQMSPEVPPEFWPIQSRNPLARREAHGLFAWPSMSRERVTKLEDLDEVTAEMPAQSRAIFGGAASPAQTAAAPAPVQSNAKPLFTRTEPATPMVNQPAKALFGPSEANTQPAPAPAANPSRALFAQNAPAPAPPAPASEAPKSRALFSFGRKEETPAAAPAPTLTPKFADPGSTPGNHTGEPVYGEKPPEAPALTEVKSTPTVEDSAGLKWRAKGSPRATLVSSETPAVPPVPQATQSTASHAAEQTQPQQTTPVAASGRPASRPVASQLVQQPSQPVKQQRALLSSSFFSGKSRGANAGSTPVSDSPQVAATSRPAPKADEKALVPQLMSMVTRVKDVAVDGETTDVVEESAPDEVTTASHIATPQDIASARSYYAPAVEYVVDSQQARTCPVHGAASHRKQTQPACEMDDASAGDDPFQDRQQQAARSQMAGQSHNVHATAPARHVPQAAAPAKKKSYRRLTMQDIASSFTRPLSFVNEITKLPSARHDDASPAEPEVATEGRHRPTIHTPYVAEQAEVQHHTLLADSSDDEFAVEMEDEDHPDVVVDTPVRRSMTAPRKPARPAIATSDDPSLDEPSKPEYEPALASDDSQGQARTIRSGRRQLTVPEVDLKDVGGKATDGLEAMHIRNSRGTKVLIFSTHDDLASDTKADSQSSGRANPLR